MNVIRAQFMRDMKVVRQWTDVDVRGFKPVPTHKHWRPTRVPRIVTHTRRINYARRLINNAVVRRNFFEPFKTQNHAQTTFDTHPLTINDGPRSIHLRITRTTHAPRRNENMCVIRAWFMRFCCVTGPLYFDNSQLFLTYNRLVFNKYINNIVGQNNVLTMALSLRMLKRLCLRSVIRINAYF